METTKTFCRMGLILITSFFGLPSTGLFSQALFDEQIILEEFQGATCIATADFNADGYVDFTATSNDGHKVSWFENDGTQQFTEHPVITGFTKAKGVTVAKIDNNTSWDIVATAKTLGRFSWFENDGTGNFTEHIVADATWNSADFVYAADIDDDGDQDLILIGCDDNRIAWAENDGTGNFAVHDIKLGWTKVNWATVYDLDDDGDKDILATAKAGQLIWFVNDGNQQFTEVILVDSVPAINSVQVADLDGDGDPDLTATACGTTDKVMWYENDGSFGFTEHILKTQYNGARASKIADLDQDGDTDILSIAWQTGVVHFWENDGTGNFAERLLSEDAYDMIQVHVADLDQDGDPDILGACYGSHEIRWWESINAFLVPGFRATPETGQLPLEVNFTDETYAKPHVYSWKWDFDNDGTVDSQEQHPQWNYTASGKYTVTLVVENDSVTDTITRENLVRVFNGESSFEFNGSNTRVQCLSEEPLNLTGNFTIEAWIKPMGFGVSGSGRILDKMMLSVYANGHSADLPNDTSLAVMMIHKDGTVSLFSTGAHTLMPGVWQHVAFSYDSISSEAHLYIDGVDQAIVYETAPSGPLMQNGTRDLYLGNARVGELGMDGSLDEVRLWDHLRTAGDINEWMEFNLPANPAGLYGYWKMNEGEGDTAFDRSGNHRDALRLTALWDLGVELLNVALPEPAKPEGATVSCFPNPAGGMVYLTIDGRFDRIFLLNAMGQIMAELSDIGGWCSLDLSPYPDGIYFLVCKVQGKGKQVKKIVKW